MVVLNVNAGVVVEKIAYQLPYKDYLITLLSSVLFCVTS